MNDRSRDIGPFVPAPDDDMIICRCEEITKGSICTLIRGAQIFLLMLRIKIEYGTILDYQHLLRQGKRNSTNKLHTNLRDSDFERNIKHGKERSKN